MKRKVGDGPLTKRILVDTEGIGADEAMGALGVQGPDRPRIRELLSQQ